MRAIFLALAFFSSVSFGQSIQRPFLYQIEKDGKSAYLLGTFHTLSLKDLPPYVLTVVEQSDVIAVEHVINLLDYFLVVGLLRPFGPSLKSELSPQAWEHLRTRLAAFDRIFNPMFPFTLSSFSPAFICALYPRMKPGQSADIEDLDAQLLKYATEKGLESKSLEGALLHLKALQASCNAQDVENLVLSDLQPGENSVSEAENVFIRVREAYLKGDEAELAEVFDIENLDENVLLWAERNRAWVPVIRNLVENSDKTAFIAAGALHLLGSKGLLALLKAEGYRITRLDSAERINLSLTLR